MKKTSCIRHGNFMLEFNKTIRTTSTILNGYPHRFQWTSLGGKSVMDWHYRGLTNTRRTKGTKFYKIRNYLALGILSTSLLFATVLNFSPFFVKRGNLSEDERKSAKVKLKELKLSLPFSVVPRIKPPPEI